MGNPYTQIEKAKDIAFSYAQIDGAHHKQWVIDQMIRALMGEDYEKFVEDYEGPMNEDGTTDYTWDTGIAP